MTCHYHDVLTYLDSAVFQLFTIVQLTSEKKQLLLLRGEPHLLLDFELDVKNAVIAKVLIEF